MSDAKDELRKAIAAHEAAVDRVEALLKEMEAAKKARDDAYAALEAARLNADKDLPRAVLHRKSRWSGVTQSEAVIIKRTAKTIWARPPGRENATAQIFRLSGNTWRISPRPRDWGYAEWLELPAEPAN